MKRAVVLAAFACTGLAAGVGAQIEVRGGGLVALGVRNAAFAGNVGEGTGTMKGFELGGRYRFVGVSARMWGGEFTGTGSADGSIANGDIRLALGLPAISAEVGMGKRAYTGSLGTVNWSFIRFGARSSLPIGGTGVSANLAIGIYAGVNSESGPEGSGKEAETSLSFAPSRLPLYLTVGYRIEQFTATASTEDRPEEVGGLVLGLGFRFAR